MGFHPASTWDFVGKFYRNQIIVGTDNGLHTASISVDFVWKLLYSSQIIVSTEWFSSSFYFGLICQNIRQQLFWRFFRIGLVDFYPLIFQRFLLHRFEYETLVQNGFWPSILFRSSDHVIRPNSFHRTGFHPGPCQRRHWSSYKNSTPKCSYDRIDISSCFHQFMAYRSGWMHHRPKAYFGEEYRFSIRFYTKLVAFDSFIYFWILKSRFRLAGFHLDGFHMAGFHLDQFWRSACSDSTLVPFIEK